MQKYMVYFLVVLVVVMAGAGYFLYNRGQQSSGLKLYFTAGLSIEGHTYGIWIENNTIKFLEAARPDLSQEVKKFERQLSPDEVTKMNQSVERLGLLNLASQDFKTTPLIPDQGRYQLSLSQNGQSNTAECGMPLLGQAENDCQEKLGQLAKMFNQLFGIDIN